MNICGGSNDGRCTAEWLEKKWQQWKSSSKFQVNIKTTSRLSVLESDVSHIFLWTLNSSNLQLTGDSAPYTGNLLTLLATHWIAATPKLSRTVMHSGRPALRISVKILLLFTFDESLHRLKVSLLHNAGCRLTSLHSRHTAETWLNDHVSRYRKIQNRTSLWLPCN